MWSSDFHDSDALQNKTITTMDGISRNHIFTVSAAESNTIMIQEHNGAPVIRQVLMLPEYQGIDWWPLFKLEVAPAAGLPDIKWNELYSKWGKFVPDNRKEGLSYYVQEPPESVKRKIAS